jgi:hypothetical protein
MRPVLSTEMLMSPDDAHERIKLSPEQDPNSNEPTGLADSVFEEIAESMIRMRLSPLHSSGGKGSPLLSELDWQVKPPQWL